MQAHNAGKSSPGRGGPQLTASPGNPIVEKEKAIPAVFN